MRFHAPQNIYTINRICEHVLINIPYVWRYVCIMYKNAVFTGSYFLFQTLSQYTGTILFPLAAERAELSPYS